MADDQVYPAPDTGGMDIFGERGSALPGSGFGARYGDTIPELRGPRKIRAFAEMREQDAVVGAVFMAIQMIIRGVSWNAELAAEADEDDAEANRARDFLKSAMADMSMTWADFIDDTLDSIWAGFYAPELVYKQRLGPEAEPHSEHNDGLIGWRKVAYRDPRGVTRWARDPNGGVRGYWHQVETRPEVFIPIEKVVLFRPTRHGNDPEGRSWFHSSFIDYTYKKKLQWLEAVGVERAGLGLPVIRPPLGANTAAGSQDLMKARDLVRNVRQDSYAGVVLPPPSGPDDHNQWQFELMAAGGGRSEAPTDTIIRRYSLGIASSVLAHFVLLVMQPRGSYALSADQRDLWQLAMRGLTGTWAELINRFMVKPLFELNMASFPNRAKWPHIEPSDVAQHDIDKVKGFVVDLLGAKALHVSDDDRNRLRALVGWPPETKADREEIEREREEARQRAPVPPGAPAADDTEDDAESGPMSAVEALVGKRVGLWEPEDAWVAAMALQDQP